MPELRAPAAGGRVVLAPACGVSLARAAKKGKRLPKGKRRVKREIERMAGEQCAQCTNDLVGFRHLFESGITETTAGKFCVTLEFGDIAYENERKDVKDAIFDKYEDLHPSFKEGSCFQINLMNLPAKTAKVDRFLPETGANREEARAYNDIIEERQKEGRTEFSCRNLVTVCVDDIRRRIGGFPARCGAREPDGPLRAPARQVLAVAENGEDGGDARALRGPEEPMCFDYRAAAAHQAPPCARLRGPLVGGLPGIGADAQALPHAAGPLREDLPHPRLRLEPVGPRHPLDPLASHPDEHIASLRAAADGQGLHAHPPEHRRGAGGDLRLPEGHRQVGRRHHHPAARLENREAEGRELLEFVQENDQSVSWFQGLITVFATTPDEADRYDRILMDEKSTWAIDIIELPLKQEAAFTSALPLATTHLPKNFRSLTSAEAATMIPFSSQNITDDPKRSLNARRRPRVERRHPNRPDKLKSPHGWIFGMTGAGKGMTVNSIITYALS